MAVEQTPNPKPVIQEPKPTDSKTTTTPKAVQKAPVKIESRSITKTLPEGMMDAADVEPGYGPTQGSPREGAPNQLANPNDPFSPITVPMNPSNPANMPAMQSDKPASEQRIYEELNNPPVVLSAESKKVVEERNKEREELHKAIDLELKKYNGLESNVPPTSSYWSNINKLRALNN
jgi:hypothetical protein